MSTGKNRVLEIVVGYQAALKAIESRCETFNDINGAGRMVVGINNPLEVVDNEGSGEFYIAVCTNGDRLMPTLEDCSCEKDIFEIQTGW